MMIFKWGKNFLQRLDICFCFQCILLLMAAFQHFSNCETFVKSNIVGGDGAGVGSSHVRVTVRPVFLRMLVFGTENLVVMGLQWLLTLELVLHAGSFICGIIAAASITFTQGHFAGECILYGRVHYNTSGNSLILESSSSPSLCYFVSAISVCMAIYCICLILYWIYASCVEDEVKRGTVVLNVFLGVCGLLLFFLVVSGCVLRIGRDRLCLSVLHNVPSISNCEEAQNRTWTTPYTGNQFYTGLYSAERSVWVSFFFWVLITAVVVVQRRQADTEDAQWSRAETEPFFHRPPRTL